MTTGWLIVNIVLVTVVAAIVTLPAVLIPYRLDRDVRVARRVTRPAAQATRERRWVADGQRREAA